MKKNVFICLFFAVVSQVFLQTAEEIVKASKTQTTVNSVGTRSKMQIQSAGKTLNVLIIDQYSSKDKNGLQRILIDFKAPANAKGTRFLMLEQKSGKTDQRIFLPALGKVRRIAAESEGDENFMGTDFSYNDVSFMSRETSLDTYKLVKEELFDGKMCNVIEAVPKDSSYLYSKTVMWIEKDKNIFRKAEFYGEKNGLVKILELSDYKDVQGIMTPMTTKLSTLKVNTSTIVTIEKIQYNMNIPDKVFTSKYLETGK